MLRQSIYQSKNTYVGTKIWLIRSLISLLFNSISKETLTESHNTIGGESFILLVPLPTWEVILESVWSTKQEQDRRIVVLDIFVDILPLLENYFFNIN